jgi:hypothetical protein
VAPRFWTLWRNVKSVPPFRKGGDPPVHNPITLLLYRIQGTDLSFNSVEKAKINLPCAQLSKHRAMKTFSGSRYLLEINGQLQAAAALPG